MQGYPKFDLRVSAQISSNDHRINRHVKPKPQDLRPKTNNHYLRDFCEDRRERPSYTRHDLWEEERVGYKAAGRGAADSQRPSNREGSG